MRWEAYVVAPVLMDGRVVGFLQGDRAAGDAAPALRDVDRDALARFAEGFAEIYERAVLRRRLRIERQELRRIATWADARTAELSDGAIDLAADRQPAEGEEADRPPAARSALRDLLTPREIDVLGHLVKGETNAEIARTLVVSEGTVKFHVKNILRKMNVSNRAEATSRYLRLALRREP
jgi:DNA-binding CsgD family transcriptional regulator